MSDFLSQEEVDALLKGVTGEADDVAEAEDTGGVRPYNLGTQERIVRGRMPTLELIHERFARYLRIGLFNFMQRSAEISLGPIRLQKYSEFIRNLVVPTNLNLVQVKPLRGTGLDVFDPNLVFLVIDNMFGGDGRFHTRVEGRDFTATEQRIIHGLLDVFFAEYERSWEPVHKIKFEYMRSEMNSQFANIATPSEIVVASTFTVELGGVSAEMHICLPYSMVEPLRDILNSSMQSDSVSSDNRWIKLLTRQVQDAAVELSVNLGDGSLTLGGLNNLKVGDIIPITIPETVTAAVDGIDVLQCKYGVQNGHYALRIERFMAGEEELIEHALNAQGKKTGEEKP
jgi:flagellar motor switch protein FliM